jgi:glutamate-ammonia-ligase adenylyltransferase
MPAGSTTILEERYLSVTRRARAVFEREFFGYVEEDEPRGYLSQ